MATTKKISVEIEADTKDAERGIDRVSEALSDAGREASKTSAKFAKVASSGTKLGASLKEAASGALTMQNALKAMAGLAAAGIAKDLASGILGIGASCIQAAAQMRQYEIAFQTMLKSASAGTEMFRSLQKFAADTPFDVPGVVSAGQQLMAFGFQAEQIIPMLTSLGDAAAGLGQGSEGVSRLAYALGQMQTSGKLNSQDMMQLTSAGVAAWDMLAQAAGVSITEIKDMTSRGMVDSKEAVKIIVAGLNEEFGGMMEKTSTEVAGLMANIEETAGTTAAVIGQYMTDAFNIKGILQEVSDALGDFQSKMQAASDAGKSFTDVIKDCVPPGVTLAVGALAAVIGTVLVAGIVAATAALGTFIGLTAPIVAGAAAIGAALAGIVVYWDEIVDAFKIGTNAVLDAITLLGTSLVRGVTGMASAITGLLGDAWGAVTGYQNNWLSDLSSVLAEATNAVAGFARRAVNYFNEVFAAKTKAFSAATPNADAEAAQLAEDFGMWQEGKSSMASPASAAPASLIKGVEASGGGSVGRSSAGGSVKNEALEAMQRENRIQEARLKAQNDNIKKQMQNEEKLRRAQVSLARKYGTDAQKLSLDLADVEYDKKQQIAEENLSYTEQLLAAENAVKEAMLKGAAQDEIDMLEEKKALLTDNHNLALATINAQATASTQALNGDYLQTLANQRMQGTTAQMTTANEQNRTDAIGDLAKKKLPEAEKLTLLDEINEKYEAQKGKIETINKLQELGNSLAKDFASGITDWITGAKDFGSAMKEVLSSLISQLIQAALYALIVASVTGGGGGFAARWKSAFGKGFAGGGAVDGEGTGTSDSIPAMLSNGEYVLNAKATKALGVPFLNGLNTGRISGFAAGGLVGGSAYHEAAGGRSSAASVSGGGSRSVSLSVNALDASGFAEFLGKGGLSAIKQALVDDDRNFNAALGTF